MWQSEDSMSEQTKIGYVIGGGLKDSFSARLTVDPLSVQEGGFVVIDSGNYRFYGLVTDIRLGAQIHALPTNRARCACRPPWPKPCTGRRFTPIWRFCPR
jgi:hypothetical protein